LLPLGIVVYFKTINLRTNIKLEVIGNQKMYIDKLSLKNFRNFKDLNINLNKGVNIFYGDNAQGKTNIIEALYFCAIGRSNRTRIDKELIKFNENEAHIQLHCKNKNTTSKIDIHIKKNFKKGIAINNIPLRKVGELFGTMYIVIFSPEDLQLIKSGPSERRKFMDIELCQLSNIYYYNLQQYYNILKQRNNLLKSIQKDNSFRDTLFVWDKQLVDFGKKIINTRTNFINSISKIASKIHFNITGGKELLSLKYKPNTEINEFKQKIINNIDKDIFCGFSNYGPHKDDIAFYINDIDVREFGSQGQKRCSILSAKLAEIEIIYREKKVKPVLLLDDVFSELDEKRQRFLVNYIKDIQTVITCTGIEDIMKNISENISIYSVKNGFVVVKSM